MAITERFRALTDEQRRAVAAHAAGRVLPIYRYLESQPTGVFDDGLRLVWLDLEGHDVSRQDYARVINAAVDALPARAGEPGDASRLAGLAVVTVLEASQHRPEVLDRALEYALDAVEGFAGEAGRRDEQTWLGWAVDVAARGDAPRRGMFSHPDAPSTAWSDEVGADELPLLGGGGGR